MKITFERQLLETFIYNAIYRLNGSECCRAY